MKKETVTIDRIKQDITHSFGAPKEMSKSQYIKWTVVALIVGILLYVIEYFDPSIVLGFLVCAIAAVLSVLVWSVIRTRRRKKYFCMDDYEITVEKLAYKNEEHFQTRQTRHTSRAVDNYDLFFENGKDWRIPDRNYLWSIDYQLSDRFFYENAHRGDEFIVVTHKKTGKIATAYHTRFFVYREETEREM